MSIAVVGVTAEGQGSGEVCSGTADGEGRVEVCALCLSGASVSECDCIASGQPCLLRQAIHVEPIAFYIGAGLAVFIYMAGIVFVSLIVAA